MPETIDPQKAKLVKLLQDGVDTWNGWREEFPLVRPDLRNLEFAHQYMNEINLAGAYLNGSDLSNQLLTKANFEGANLSGTNLANASLRGANLTNADLSGATLTDANLKQANLTGANLKDALLITADLSDSMLNQADLSGANLNYTDLSGATLVGASLNEANLGGAILRLADLTDSDLSSAHLHEADFSEANLSRARLLFTVFGGTNFRKTLGLDTCRHFGPSFLDLATLAKSGPLPLPFLRGCGLPDIFIDYLPSLLSNGIEFYSCFISYSTKDQEFADRLHADLQNQGIRCWFAPHNIQGGKKIYKQIDEAIRAYDRLLLILTPSSMNSEWVKTEIAKARVREVKENRTVLFPVRLVDFDTLRRWECFDADTGKDSAREIREYYIPDFSNWKEHGSYQTEFEKLLRDLKAERKSAPSAK